MASSKKTITELIIDHIEDVGILAALDLRSPQFLQQSYYDWLGLENPEEPLVGARHTIPQAHPAWPLLVDLLDAADWRRIYSEITEEATQ